MAVITLTLPKPHAGQEQIINSRARFHVVACGRRFGKTIVGINRLIGPALEGYPVAWFSPTYKMLAEVWREAKKILKPITASIDSSGKRIELITGGVIDFWSLTNYDSIRGRKYKRVVIDEAAMCRSLGVAWQEVIRPTLTDYRGDAYFLSTPKGRNFFYDCFQRGLDPLQGEWAAYQMPTTTNPHIDPAEVEAARNELPEIIYLQEYLAQFLDSGAGVFRKLLEAAVAERQERALRGHTYVVGIDFARSGDFTVISVIDVTPGRRSALVYLDRFNQVDYDVQVGRIKAMYDVFRR